MNLKFGAAEIRGLMKMVQGFSVLRLTAMTPMIGVNFTKEELLAMNRRLNRIRRAKEK